MVLTDFDTPQSRVEAILQNALGASNAVYPQSRVEELLVKLDELLEGIDDPEEFERIITDWLEENIEPGAAAVIDKTLTIEGAAADAKIVGTELTGVKRDLNDKAPVVIETASGSIASFSDGADDMPMKSLIVNIEPVQSGSGDPSPDNVRPISGWTGCEVAATGVNVWDEEWEVGEYHIDSGVKTGSAGVRSKNPIRIVGGAQYRLYAKTAAASNNIGFCFYDADGNYISGGVSSQTFRNVIVTAPQNARYLNFFVPNSWYGSTYNHDISINYPSTDHDYHESHAKSYPISWQSEAGTVYGGTLDVVSGLLTVDMAMVDLGTLTWTYDNSGFFYRLFDDKANTENIVCSVYKNVGLKSDYDMTHNVDDKVIGSGINNPKYVLVRDTAYTDAATFKSAMSGVQLVYELAIPQTYQLTPTEVKSILGLNNVWADCGDVSVEYRADTKMFVESQILDVPVEDVQINGTSIVSDGVANIPMPKTVNVTGTTPTITAQADTRYICGEVASLDFTPPASGICDVVFTSGSIPTVLTVPSTVKWANGFDPTSLDANTTYEINIMDGLGVASAWA